MSKLSICHCVSIWSTKSLFLFSAYHCNEKCEVLWGLFHIEDEVINSKLILTMFQISQKKYAFDIYILSLASEAGSPTNRSGSDKTRGQGSFGPPTGGPVLHGSLQPVELNPVGCIGCSPVGWRLQPMCGPMPPPMSSCHHNLEPLGMWHAVIYISF